VTVGPDRADAGVAVPAAARRSGPPAIRTSWGLLAGLLVNGVATYAFLALTARSVGAASFSTVSVLWATLFLVGLGCFVPFEQEGTRVVAEHRERGTGSLAEVQRIGTVGLGLLVAIDLLLVLSAPWLAGTLFRGDAGFVLLVAIGLPGLLGAYLTRGVLAGAGRYLRLGVFYAVEGAARLGAAMVLAAAGVRSGWSYGLTIGLGSLVAAGVCLIGIRRPVERGTAPPLRTVVRPLAQLMATTLLIALMMNLGPIAVEVLAGPDEVEIAGVFLSGLVIARVPLFLLQAIQALVLPRLTRLATAKRMAEFRRELRWILAAMLLFTVVAVVGSALLGPAVHRALFGAQYADLGGVDMAMLTASSMLMMLVFTINQAQIALSDQGRTAYPWLAGVVAFVVVVLASGPDLLRRVELGLVVGNAVVVVTAGALLAARVRRTSGAAPI
jgi:O-antigen/teichoic acid export membrane protein